MFIQLKHRNVNSYINTNADTYSCSSTANFTKLYIWKRVDTRLLSSTLDIEILQLMLYNRGSKASKERKVRMASVDYQVLQEHQVDKDRRVTLDLMATLGVRATLVCLGLLG